MRHTNGKALAAITAAVLLLGAAACEGGGVRDPALGMMGPPGSSTLSSIQSSVFSPSCAFVGCHAGVAPAQGLDLSPGAALGNLVGVPSSELALFLRVKPGDAADSYLFMKLVDDTRIDGQPMPLVGNPLESDGWTWYFTGGSDFALSKNWNLTAELFYSPLDVLRPGYIEAETDGLFNARVLVRWNVR